MSIAHLLYSAGLFVIEDARAKHRRSDIPESIRLSYFDYEDIIDAVNEAASRYPAVLALILKTGQVVVMAEEGKGGIGLQGSEGSLSEEQQASLDIVSEVLCALYGVPMDGAKSSRKKAAPEPAPEDALTEPISEEPADEEPA